MAKIIAAKTAGFCMGVHRAVDMVFDALNKSRKPIYTYGPLIHNSGVLALLEKKRVSILNSIPEKGNGTVLIRAHGVPLQTKTQLEKAGFNVIDATCPRVIKVQNIIKKYASQGYCSIIAGDKDHPEVKGLLGYAGENGYVVEKLQDLDNLPRFQKAILVAQTTQNISLFQQIEEKIKNNFPDYKIFHTICDSTLKRQTEIKQLSETADSIVVIGGYNSGNTKRLAEIAARSGKPVYHIESEAELDLNGFSSSDQICITAGASTPNWIIKKVLKTLETALSNKNSKKGIISKIQRALILTNIYVAIGAASLCAALIRLQAITDYFPYLLISFLYVQSMHTLNNLTRKKSDDYNDPERAFFYQKHKKPLAFLALISGFAGLAQSFFIGTLPFIFLLIMSAAGLSYNLKIFPKSFKYVGIKEIPGAKTILISLAWALVTAVLPSVSANHFNLKITGLAAFLFSFSMVFVRTAFFDILDIQGDRIVGKESIPIIIGEKRTLKLLKQILWANLLLLPIAAFSSIFTNIAFLLVIFPILMFLVISRYQKNTIIPGTGIEFLMESNFIIAGLTALIWTFI